MSESLHTPGPWMYQAENTPTRVTGPKNEQIAAVYGGMVGEVEQLSNARLIAAAPALLDYIATKADGGDKEAKDLLGLLEARTDQGE